VTSACGPTDPDSSSPGVAGAPRGLLRWLRRGVWALADQGFASVGNFLIHVILARSLDPAAYGTFVVAFQVLALLVMIHAAVIADPLMVLVPGRYLELRDEYLRTVMLIQAGIAGIAFVLPAAAGLVLWGLGRGSVAVAFGGLALAAPAMLTLVALRRVAFARFATHLAAIGGAANLVLILGGLAVLHRQGRLGVLPAFLVLACSAAVVVALLWRWLALRNPFASPWPLAEGVLESHRHYGKWGVPAGALSWVPGNVYYLLLPLLPGAAFGLSATAALRALVNLIMPVLQANAALGSLLIPALSARRRAGRRSNVSWMAGALVGGSVLYGMGIVAFGRPLVSWLYGGRYAADLSLLALLAVIPLLTAASHLLRGVALADERPDRLFWAYLGAALASVGAGLPLVLWLGLHGVLVAIALGPATQTAVLWSLARAGRVNRP
jgi:O-antigen/teichoic acid export membrane protein